MKIERRKTFQVPVGDKVIGSDYPILVQSMCATRTQDLTATSQQINLLHEHGADLIRIAIDSRKDVDALEQLRKQTDANLVVDLQENYRLIDRVGPMVQKVRYNPGHLHHHEKSVPVRDKVAFIVESARRHDCALRIGVNFGSLDPALKGEQADPIEVALASVGEHVGYMQELGFERYVVSLKSSSPEAVIAINERFAERFSMIPLHLGVTEAGMPPEGVVKTRLAFEALLARGIGDTVRVSLTLPHARKHEEVEAGRSIVEDVYAGRFRGVPKFSNQGLNIISCPSCSRVENEAFIDLAEQVKEMSAFASAENITIAVMGCRVNGPGETDDADLGLWCAPRHVNLKRGTEVIGAFSYEEIIPRLQYELGQLIEERQSNNPL